MGAYLHLRGLAYLDDLSDTHNHTERSCYKNERGSGNVAVASTSIPGRVSTIGEKGNSPATNAHMNDCSNFWAGQIDHVFEEPEVRTGYSDAPSVRTELDGRALNDTLITRERGLMREEKGGSWSRKRGSIENAYLDGQIKENSSDVSSAGHLGVIEDIHQRIVSGTELVACFTGGMVTDTAASGNSGAVLSREGLKDGNESGGLEKVEFVATHHRRGSFQEMEDETESLPDHLLIEVLVRVPTPDWPAAACVKKRWAQLFKGDGLWHSALMKKWPGASTAKRWPGPISRGSSKRRYTALCVSDSLFAKDKVEGVNEVAGHVYLFLKEQLESCTPPVSYGLLHGTIIDQFLACCKTGDEARDLASQIWVAVLDNLDESESTFHLLMRIAEEWEVFLPYPYSKSHAVQWRLFERLFTDFRDCLSQYNYFDVLTRVRNKFELIPQTWLGY